MNQYDSLLDTAKKFHFIGIGGSGMCPLAEILHHEGYALTGSDVNETDTLARIRSYGIPVYMGHRACLLYTSFGFFPINTINGMSRKIFIFL